MSKKQQNSEPTVAKQIRKYEMDSWKILHAKDLRHNKRDCTDVLGDVFDTANTYHVYDRR